MGTLFLVAMVLDVIYQIIVLRWVYPGPALIVATTLAIVPYLVVRGLANRVAARILPRRPPDGKESLAWTQRPRRSPPRRPIK